MLQTLDGVAVLPEQEERHAEVAHFERRKGCISSMHKLLHLEAHFRVSFHRQQALHLRINLKILLGCAWRGRSLFLVIAFVAFELPFLGLPMFFRQNGHRRELREKIEQDGITHPILLGPLATLND